MNLLLIVALTTKPLGFNDMLLGSPPPRPEDFLCSALQAVFLRTFSVEFQCLQWSVFLDGSEEGFKDLYRRYGS